MDVAYINPFITATHHVFETMVHVPFMLGRPHLREDAAPSCVVAAKVDLSGPVTGSVVLCFPDAVARALVAGLTGAPCEEVDADCRDALGEITSMIAGNAKKDFPNAQVSISTPRVVLPGEVAYPAKDPVIVIPCTTGKGRLAIEVALHTPPRAKAGAEGAKVEAAPEGAKAEEKDSPEGTTSA